MYKLIAFDLDETLIHTVSGESYPAYPQDATWLPGRLQSLFTLHTLGIKTAIVTNQGGVGAGYRSKKDVDTRLYRVLSEGNIEYLRVCYSHNAKNPRRKPNPGMLLELLEVTGYGSSDVLYVGDYPADLEAARRAKIDFLWSDESAATKYGEPGARYYFRKEVPLFYEH
jgi:D-glycero-D-manno-heptose 1,7-bisphosphate phosphatase